MEKTRILTLLKVTPLGLVDIGVPFVFAVSGSDGFFAVVRY